MTIEEKAKAYDEAKARMRRAWNDNRCTIGFMNEIFPELKESEDEKVKKILHSISSKMSFHLHDIFTEEEFQCFDAWSNIWLEKQGEEKSANKEELASSEKVSKNDTLLDLLHKMPSCVTVDGIDYHFVMGKTSYYLAYYKGNKEEYSGNAIFGVTAFSPIDLLTAMLEILKEKGLLE